MSIRKERKKENPVLKKIKELIPQAPPSWKEVIAEKMGVTQDAVSKYIRGDRGLKKDKHIEVLRQLKKLVELQDKRNKALLQ